jgi:hypothetical protein
VVAIGGAIGVSIKDSSSSRSASPVWTHAMALAYSFNVEKGMKASV